MLTTSNISPQQGEAYYSQENYYSQQELVSHSRWLGNLAIALGLKGQINPQDCKQLLYGYLPNGQKFRHRKPTRQSYKVRAGLDCTLSAPKSVSIMALIFGDTRLIQAHRDAVKTVLHEIEQRYSLTRVRTPTGRQVIQTGNLAIAVFDHDTSRELDPHLHSHCLILNCTQVGASKWYSIVNDPIHRHKKLLGMSYQNELAINVQKLGYEIQQLGHGQFEIKGFTRQQIETFSKRWQQIHAQLAPKASWSERERIWNQTRSPKGKPLPRQELQTLWISELSKLNFTAPRPAKPRVYSETEARSVAEAAIAEALKSVGKQQEFQAEALLKKVLRVTGQVRTAALWQAIEQSPGLLYGQRQLLTAQPSNLELAAQNQSIPITAQRFVRVQRQSLNQYQPGDVLVLARDYRRQRLVKGESYEVVGKENNQLVIKQKGLVHKIDPKVAKRVYAPQSVSLTEGDRLKWTRNDPTTGRRRGQEFAIAYTDANLAHIQYPDGRFDTLDFNQPHHISTTSIQAQHWQPASRQTALLRQQLRQELAQEALIGAKPPAIQPQMLSISPQALARRIQMRRERRSNFRLLSTVERLHQSLNPVSKAAPDLSPLKVTGRQLGSAIMVRRQAHSLQPTALPQLLNRLEVTLEHFQAHCRADTIEHLMLSAGDRSVKQSDANLSSTVSKPKQHEHLTHQLFTGIDGSRIGSRVAERLRANHGRTLPVSAATPANQSAAPDPRRTRWGQAVDDALGANQNYAIAGVPGDSPAQGSRSRIPAPQSNPAIARRIDQVAQRLRAAEQAYRAANPATEAAVRSLGELEQAIDAQQSVLGSRQAETYNPSTPDIARSPYGVKSESRTIVHPDARAIPLPDTEATGEPGIEPDQFKTRPGQLSRAIARRVKQRGIERVARAVGALDRSVGEIHSAVRGSEALYAALRAAVENQDHRIDAQELKAQPLSVTGAKLAASILAYREQQQWAQVITPLEALCDRLSSSLQSSLPQLESWISASVQEALAGQPKLSEFLRRLNEKGLQASLNFDLSHSKIDSVLYEVIQDAPPDLCSRVGDRVLGPECDTKHLWIQESQKIDQTIRTLLNDLGLGQRQGDGSLSFDTQTLSLQQKGDEVRVFAKDGRGELLRVQRGQMRNFKLSLLDLKVCDRLIQKVDQVRAARLKPPHCSTHKPTGIQMR